MAHKSKTQRAKAAAAKENRKDRIERDEALREHLAKVEAGEIEEEEPAQTKAIEKKAKKERFKFLKDVRAEMKRVTWPTRQDVMRWSVVVVGALVFFGVFTAVLDNLIITPALVALSGLGA